MGDEIDDLQAFQPKIQFLTVFFKIQIILLRY
jgi:hypothetical protein